MNWLKVLFSYIRNIRKPKYDVERILETVEHTPYMVVFDDTRGVRVEIYNYNTYEGGDTIEILDRIADFIIFAKKMQEGPYIRPGLLEKVKFIFVPKSWKCKYHKSGCSGVWDWAYKNNKPMRTRYIMVAKNGSGRFKNYKHFSFLEHELAHALGIMDNNHNINFARYNKNILKDFKMGSKD